MGIAEYTRELKVLGSRVIWEVRRRILGAPWTVLSLPCAPSNLVTTDPFPRCQQSALLQPFRTQHGAPNPLSRARHRSSYTDRAHAVLQQGKAPPSMTYRLLCSGLLVSIFACEVCPVAFDRRLRSTSTIPPISATMRSVSFGNSLELMMDC